MSKEAVDEEAPLSLHVNSSIHGSETDNSAFNTFKEYLSTPTNTKDEEIDGSNDVGDVEDPPDAAEDIVKVNTGLTTVTAHTAQSSSEMLGLGEGVPVEKAQGEQCFKSAAINDADEDKEKVTYSKCYVFSEFLSTMLFVIGSVLYLIMSVKDYQWANTLNTLPMYLRIADDDITWYNYKAEEAYNASLLEGAGGGVGVRRMKSRQLWMKEEEEARRMLLEQAANGNVLVRRGTHNMRTAKAAKSVSVVESKQRTLQTMPDEQYYDTAWADLPSQIQAAYATLGYNEERWNLGLVEEVWSEEALWGQFTPEQLDAATTLGYTEDIWCETLEPALATQSKQPTVKPITMSPTLKPTTGSPTLKPVSSSPTKGPSLPVNGESSTSITVYWDDLPTGSHDIYSVLGYNETSWNRGAVGIDGMSWEEMDIYQRFAAMALGWDKELWNGKIGEHFPSKPQPDALVVTTRSPTTSPNASVPTTSSPITDTLNPTVPTPSPENDTPSSTSLEPTSTSQWIINALNPASSPGEVTSNTDESSQPDPSSPETGNANEGVIAVSTTSAPSPSSQWMVNAIPTPPVQIEVATTSAPVDSSSPEISLSTPDVTMDALYADSWWKDIPPEVQAAYSTMGYNETSWNGALGAPSDEMMWDELTTEMQEAATFLGYTQVTWDAEPVPSPPLNSTFTFVGEPSINGTNVTQEASLAVIGMWDDYGWTELPQDIQEALTTLGYDQKIWNYGGAAFSDALMWEELTPEQQVAAAKLGYNLQLWNGIGEDGEALVVDDDDYVSYDDDYVMQVSNLDVWISKYQIFYFFAALSFVFVGFLDLTREKHKFHILMILAGIFGVMSAVYVEADIRISNILNCVSVNLYLFEGIALFGDYKRASMTDDAPQWMKRTVMLGNLEFIIGALLDVILSYFYLFDDTADWDASLMITGIFAAVCWLHCSLIYVGSFFLYPEAKTVD